MSIPKIAVLATGLTAAILVAMISPQAAQATPGEQADCTGCHSGGEVATMTLSLLGTPTMAPSTDYAISIAMSTVNSNGGAVGWWIAESDSAGITGQTATVCRTSSTPVPAAPACYGGPALSTSFFPRMTAPAEAGTYYYKVWMNQGPDDASSANNFKIFSITVTAPPVTTTTEPPVTTTTEPPVTTTTEPPVTTTTEAPTSTTTAPPVVLGDTVTGDGTAVIPVGAPDTGAGGAASPTDGSLAGLSGLALLLAGAGATQVLRRRQQV
jgi:hypothetical protein